MVNQATLDTVGAPNEGVTHWGIARLERGTWTRLDASNEHGVYTKEFPLELLDLSFIRKTWGAGEYQVYWFKYDPNETESKKRHKGEGKGREFRVDAPPPEPVEEPKAAAVVPPVGGDMAAMLTFATTLMQMSDRRAQSQVEAIAAMAGVRTTQAPSLDPTIAAALAESRAATARLEAELQAEKIRREEREKYEAEKRRLEDDLRRERDKRRDLERDSDRGIEAPEIRGTGILDILNFAMKNPALIAAVAGPVIEGLKTAAAAPQAGGAPPPSGVPAPRPMPAPSAPPREGAQAGMPSVPMAPTPAPVARETVPAGTVPVVGPNGAAHPPARVPSPPPAATPPSAPAAPQAPQ